MSDLDQAIREVLLSDGCCNWWIIKVRDPSKRKNAKPVDIMLMQGTYNIIDAIEEAMEGCRRGADLDAVTIEARRMTQAEIDKWDRDTDRRARREGYI